MIGDNELIEVKCFFKVAKLGIGLEEAAETIPTLCLENINNKVSLKRTHNYYYQVQGQLHITQRQMCYFVVFINVETPLFIERIYQDDSFWNDSMINKLATFYNKCILPEIIRGNLKRGLRCVDPDYILLYIA